MKTLTTVALLFFITFISDANAKDLRLDAVKLVKDAIEYSKKNGKDAVISEINKGKFKDGDTYVTLYDLDGTCLAHPTSPTRIGQNFMNEKDPDGKFFVKERIELVKAKGSGWQTYTFMNPKTKKSDSKEAYNELHDGVVFSCGVYKKSFIYNLNK